MGERLYVPLPADGHVPARPRAVRGRFRARRVAVRRARANSGVQDADNLAWKLKLVLDGRSADSLLDTYASEREFAADENIRNSTRSTDFITPKSPVSRVFRDATLKLARDCEFARKLVNSGRLSVPAVLADSPLNTPDRNGDAFAGAMRPARRRPMRRCVRRARRAGCCSIWAALHRHAVRVAGRCGRARAGARRPRAAGAARARRAGRARTRSRVSSSWRTSTASPRNADAKPGTFYLLRPDQHVCARALDRQALADALARATCAR